MSINYTALAIETEAIIAANGRAIEILKSNTTANDVAKPWRGVTASFPAASGANAPDAYGVFLDYRRRDVDGDTIKRGDKRVLVAANGLDDLSGYEGIRDGTEVWRIVGSKTLAPGAVRLLYEFQVRQ